MKLGYQDLLDSQVGNLQHRDPESLVLDVQIYVHKVAMHEPVVEPQIAYQQDRVNREVQTHLKKLTHTEQKREGEGHLIFHQENRESHHHVEENLVEKKDLHLVSTHRENQEEDWGENSVTVFIVDDILSIDHKTSLDHVFFLKCPMSLLHAENAFVKKTSIMDVF